jgi:DNA-binding transcriptional MocR family regulator
MDSWKPDRKQLTAPIYKSLADQIAAAIADGSLPGGAQLLPQRHMAHDLDISVQTVSRAYDDLERRGLLSGETGRGTFVKNLQQDRGPPFTLDRIPEVIDLSILKPVGESIHEEQMKAALAALAADLPSRIVHAFRPESAASRHRAAAVRWLAECGVETAAQNICITNGATSALTVALMTLAPPGAVIATEVLGHHSLRPLANYMGVRLEAVGVDEQGILPKEFEKACSRERISALVVQPTVINPTGSLLPEARRRAIVDIAARFDVRLVENDALGPLVASKPPTFFSLAPERTFYVTSFTKIVMPGLRIGYLAMPPKYVTTASNRHLVTSWMATPLLEEIATRWVEDGTAMNLVHWQREALATRHAMFQQIAGGYGLPAHPQSLHRWIPLPRGHSEADFIAHARSHGVAVARASSFLADERAHEPAIRVSIGSVDADHLSVGLQAIANILGSPPEPPLSTS